MSILKNILEFYLPTAGLFKGKSVILLACVVCFFAACNDDPNPEFDSPIVMKSPLADDINISESSDGTTLTFSWPREAGAGGYEFSLYMVTKEGENLEIVGEEKEIVWKPPVVSRPLKEATYYKVVLKTLGSETNNTSDAVESTIVFWDNVPPDMPLGAIFVPRGSNLTQFFINNPITEHVHDPDLELEDETVYYALSPGGNYTMGGLQTDNNVYTGLKSVVLFGADKKNPAKLKMLGGSFVTDGAGLMLKNLEIDYSEFDGDITGVIVMNTVQNPKAEIVQALWVHVPVSTPIGFESCKITGLKYSLFWDSNTADFRYLIGHFLVDDCIIGYDSENYNQACIRFDSSIPKDLTIKNSTLYNVKQIAQNGVDEVYQLRLIRVGRASHAAQFAADLPEWTGGNLLIQSCTFYNFSCGVYPGPVNRGGSQSFNSGSCFGQATDTKSVIDCVVVNSFEYNEPGVDVGQAQSGTVFPNLGSGNCFISRLFGGSAVRIARNNTYWSHGRLHSSNVLATPDPESTSSGRDASGTHIESDPMLKHNGNGNFTMDGVEQIARRTGDPKWLP